MNPARTIILTAILALPCSVPFVASTSMESRVMSQQQSHKQFLSWIDQIWEQQGRPKYIDLNAIDPNDPVHDRRGRERRTENDYDGDLGRDHEDTMRDNGLHSRGMVAGTFRQIADALPVIEAPSIVPDHGAAGEITKPDTQAQRTLEYLRKRESEG